MDINPQSAKPISDDAELAKVLAGVNQQTDQPLQFDTPPVVPPTTPTATPSDNSVTPPTSDNAVVPETPVTAAEPTEPNPYETSPLPEPTTASTPSTPTVSGSNDLSDIKKDALNDLRPLVGKLDIPAEEKFDTYLLLIRSTDDKTLIEPAYAAAQAIADESRKAQALLDVIKEIDYLSNPPK
jgi:hypothetical protein